MPQKCPRRGFPMVINHMLHAMGGSQPKTFARDAAFVLTSHSRSIGQRANPDGPAIAAKGAFGLGEE
jgi:hypothetical protein